MAHTVHNIQLAAYVFQLIKGAPCDECGNLLRIFLSGYGTSRTDEKLELPTYISDEEKKAYLRAYGPIVNQALQGLQESNPTEEQFYDGLWNYLESGINLPESDEKARYVALFNLAIDRHLPYYQFDRSNMLSMTNREYAEILAII